MSTEDKKEEESGEENTGGTSTETTNAETNNTQPPAEKKPVDNRPKTQEEIAFNLTVRKAEALAKSDLLPKAYKGNIANCLIAFEMAERMGMNPLMVMQNLHLIEGKPSWSSPFCVAGINSDRRFKTKLNYRMKGEGDTLSCVAFAHDHEGNLFEGPEVTMAMAKAEGWLDKKGSKWKTMPALMIRYRAAAFFSRLFCPELLMGLQTEDEVIDVTAPYATVEDQETAEGLRAEYNEKQERIAPEVQIAVERILDNQEVANYKKVRIILNNT